MKVGVLTASISPRAGGLLHALAGLTRALQSGGEAVEIFAGQEPDGMGEGAGRALLRGSLCRVRGPRSFAYMPDLRVRLDDSGLDLLHTHGLWMYPSVAAEAWRRRTERPTVVAPHGMLDPWALRNSAWKKRLAGLLYEGAHLRRSSCITALCESEYRAIRSHGLRNPVAVIPNGVDLPEEPVQGQPDWAEPLPQGSRVLLFLGRIHPKKGLVNLLHAWSAVQRRDPTGAESWQLVVAGWDQGGHQAVLEGLAADLGVTRTVHFVGPQFEENRAASLGRADAFVLPSFSEGLPMAVLEAWSYELPVLMTLECNLPEGFVSGAAMELKPEVGSIADGLARCFDLRDEERRTIGRRGRALVESRFTWTAVAEEMRAVYSWLLGLGPCPACIRLG